MPMMPFVNVLSFSGGKDSCAMYLYALERGIEFEAVFADTGNEHPATLEYVATIHEKTGGPAVRTIRADLTEWFERRRRYVAEKWPEKGVPAADVARALAALQPTGIPFLDLCLIKGRFPSRRAQFCTQFLKREPILEQVVIPHQDAGRIVVSWQGVRRDESAARRHAPRVEYQGPQYIINRPLVDWTAADCIAMHRRHGIDPNPLYAQGCGRVGCMPCINPNKGEIRNMAARWPEVVDRIRAWEALVCAASKHGGSTFFPVNTAPGEIAPIDEVVRWSRTTRGGRAFDLFTYEDEEPTACASALGLCE